MGTIWPQLTYLLLGVLCTGYALAKHGDRKDGYYSVWTQLYAIVVSWGLLYYGGFFAPLGFAP